MTRIVARRRDHNGEPVTEVWDEVPSTYGWIKRWGPADRVFATLRDAVEGSSQDGPAAMYVPEGNHARVTKLDFDPKNGVPRRYSTHITNAFDTDYIVAWSNFRRTG